MMVPPSKVNGPKTNILLEATLEISSTATKTAVIKVKNLYSFILYYYTVMAEFAETAGASVSRGDKHF